MKLTWLDAMDNFGKLLRYKLKWKGFERETK